MIVTMLHIIAIASSHINGGNIVNTLAISWSREVKKDILIITSYPFFCRSGRAYKKSVLKCRQLGSYITSLPTSKRAENATYTVPNENCTKRYHDSTDIVNIRLISTERVIIDVIYNSTNYIEQNNYPLLRLEFFALSDFILPETLRTPSIIIGMNIDRNSIVIRKVRKPIAVFISDNHSKGAVIQFLSISNI